MMYNWSLLRLPSGCECSMKFTKGNEIKLEMCTRGFLGSKLSSIFLLKGKVMQVEKALINDRLRVLKVS